jgi:hypothetical protein
MSNTDRGHPHEPGSSLAIGLILVMWGVFLYIYPQSAHLPEWMQTLALFLSFVCFIMGAITAGAGVTDLRQSQFMSYFSIALALALIAYAFYFVSERVAEHRDVALVAKIAVVPAALAAIAMFGLGLPHLLAPPPVAHDDQPEPLPESAAVDRGEPQAPGVGRFERAASAALAFVSLAAAIAALINEVRRGP